MDIFYNYKSYTYLQQHPKKPTESEIILAGALVKLGVDYEMQARISDTTVDGLIKEFFAPAKVIIEVDGSYHNNRKQKMIDARRMVLHSHLGYHTIRVTNEEIEKDLDMVVLNVLGNGMFLRNIEGNLDEKFKKDYGW